MLVEGQSYKSKIDDRRTVWSDSVFRYCTFDAIGREGDHVDSTFIECTFENCDWYWALFNVAIFVNVRFQACTFRGCSLAGCKFVDCEFTDCAFTVDSFGKGCRFDETRWYGCKQERCTGIESVFANPP